MCQTLNLQMIICFVCPNRSCSDWGLSVSSILGGLFSRRVLIHLSFTRKWLLFGMPSSMLKSNQNIIANKTPLELLLVEWYLLFWTSRGVCLLVLGEYKLYHYFWEPPVMYLVWKIPRSLGCYVDNESMPLKILFISVSKTRALAPLQIPASLCKGPIYLVLLLSHHPIIKSIS